MDCDIALIGLAVMGQNFIMNMNDHGFKVCAFNRTVSKVDDFLNHAAKGSNVVGAKSLEEMVSRLKKPRRTQFLSKWSCEKSPKQWKVMLLVKAGKPVDDFIATLLPHLEKGDIIIDGGNSEFSDTTRRVAELEAKGFLYVGSGVSGGEDGARYGPSLMPGGSSAAWPHLKSIFQSCSAKVEGEPCCDWVGEGGAGHFVKMVHNGIEYGDMQLICEAYQLMRDLLGYSHDQIADVFTEWNTGVLDSFLIEITAAICRYRESDGSVLLERIRDAAGQKGTGKWTAITSLDHGMPVTLIGEAVFSRCLSSLSDERSRAADMFPRTKNLYNGDKCAFVKHIEKALFASKIISYAQGFMLMRAVSEEKKWKLNYGAVALMWRGGCIIRSTFLGDIKAAFDKNSDLPNLLFDDFFRNAINEAQDSWREVVATAVRFGIPTPCFSTALAYFDGYRTKRLPANLIQAQRDYFGAHTFEYLDKPGEFHHANWTGHTGQVASSTYQV